MRLPRIALPALAPLFLLPPAATAQQAFEGVISYRMTAQGQSMTMTQMTKGSKVRTEMEMPGMPGPFYVLMDLDEEVVRSVVPAMGMYMEVNLKDALNQVPLTEEMRAMAAQTPQFERLSTSDRIAGVACHDYRITQGTGAIEMCVATGLGHLMGGRGGGAPGAGSPLAALGVDLGKVMEGFMKEFKDGMLPLRVRTQENGAWHTFMEATSVERKTLEASLFELPPGLRKMNMPGGG